MKDGEEGEEGEEGEPMKVFGVSEVGVQLVTDRVSRSRYGCNVIIRDSRDESNSRGDRASFTLRVASSGGQGARLTRYGHRSPAACYHVHYDVIQALLAAYPQARIATALATYTIDTFEHKAGDLADADVGSTAEPLRFADACLCEAERLS